MAAALALVHGGTVRRAVLATVIAFCCASLPVAAKGRIPAPVAAALKAANIPQSAVALVVQDAGARRAQLAINAGQPMNPASTMKLVTTYAALDLLGPAYTWKTEAVVAAPPADGVIKGDLYLKGSGDPKFTLEQFWLLLRQLRARGVREIGGDLVLDNGAFDLSGQDPVPFDDQPLRPYNVRPDALLLNFKTLRLTLVPDAAHDQVHLLPEPWLDNLDIDNRMRIGGGQCGEWRDALQAGQTRQEERYRLTLEGEYPAACGEKIWNLAVLDPAHYLGAVFRQLWRELGGEFRGAVRMGSTPIGTLPLAVIESPALAEIVRDINKYSNNVMARQLYLTLGVALEHRAARPADAEAVIRTWLAVKGLDFPELVLENGAGLSRRERISAASLAQLLQSVWASPLMPELMASLPLVAVDGTMKKRLQDAGVGGRAHIKTGTLDGVKALAGYVQDKKGRYRIVVLLINHPRAEAARDAQDALLEWVYERKG